MSEISFSKSLKSFVFVLLSFILSFVLFLISLAVVLEATVLNSDFVLENMSSSDYFLEKKDEITQSLVDLGYASGLNEEFFDGIVDEIMLISNTDDYIIAYYSGDDDGAKISTTDFKKSFNDALDDYIAKNDVGEVDAESREYLVSKASSIYRNSLEIPLLSRISAYVIALKNAMPYVIAGLAVFAVIIGVILFFGNSWKHRAVKYFCHSFMAAFLTVGVISAVALISGTASKINLTSRALYNFFVQSCNSIMIALLFCAILYFVISVVLYFQYRNMRKKVSD